MRRAGLLGGALVAMLLPAPASADIGKFVRGVAAGEITHTSALLWAQTKKPGKVQFFVFNARNEKLVDDGKAKAKASNDNTVQVESGGLKPGAVYIFQFCQRRGPCSKDGEFTTAPKPNKAQTIDFAYTGDADGTPLPGEKQPFFGSFDIYKAMAGEANHFNVNMGDTIYSDSGVGNVPPALTTEEKWGKYRQVIDQKNTRTLRGSTGLYSHWDDHEFINDFSIPEDGQPLYEAGVEAFTDYAPVDYSPQDGLYRTFRWGSNLELFFLDERSFRSAKADAGGVCNNPSTGSPDLAPTAPQSKRNLFAALIPSLNQPVSQACKDAINDPSRTLLGQAQRTRFLQQVAASDARFKVIMNETPIQQFYGLPYDRWEGYAHERVQLLNDLMAQGVKNLVFLTTDTHAAFANVVRTRTFSDDFSPANAPAAPQDTPYNDHIIGPVATNTFWAEIDEQTNTPGAGNALSQAFFKPPPPDGVGMSCAQGDVNSYAQVRVTNSQLTIEYKDESGNTVLDVNGQPCGPYVIQAQ